MMHAKPSANGSGRRRVEKDAGPWSAKPQSGKSVPNKFSTTGVLSSGKYEVSSGPSRDRLVYLTTSLIGHNVEVQLKNGSVYTGMYRTASIEEEFAIVLRMACLIKDAGSQEQKMVFVSKDPSIDFVIPGENVVQVIAKNVSLAMDGVVDDLQLEKQDIMIDSVISQSRHVEMGRELAPWVPDDDIPEHPELENIFDDPWNRGWDQFQANEALFGVKSTFDEELYTTKLEKGPRTWELEREAMRIAREIEGEDTRDIHLAEERGIHLPGNIDIDEETRFSSVVRSRMADDSGYDETDDLVLDLHTDETFGTAPTSSARNPTGFAHDKSSDGSNVLSRSSLDDQPGQVVFERASQSSSNPDAENRIPENTYADKGAEESSTELVEREALFDGAQLATCADPQSLIEKIDASSTLRNTAHDPLSHIPSKSHDRTNSSARQSEGVVSLKGSGESQSMNSHVRPGSSASSSSDRVAAASGSGLSRSSSVASLSSEKSTLNPNAKEFKLNPNAKSFTPSQTHVRPPSPVPDSSFYFPGNVSGLPPMPGMPMGVGMGPSFPGHPPVIYNPQVSPLQTPPAYFHPDGLQYGQQMFLGHPRQVMYMPGYQTDMQYK